MIPVVAKRLLGPVSRETEDRLCRYAEMFDEWSKRINLVGASTCEDFWDRHVIDSAQLAALKPQARHWTDLGSGGGFPGMVLAILMSDREGGRVDLVESNRKKAAFLQVVRAECAPAAHIHAQRIEDAVPRLKAPECVTARALAPLPRLIAWTEPWLERGTLGLFHKGRGFEAEAAESRANWSVDLVEHTSMVAADSVIIEVRSVATEEI